MPPTLLREDRVESRGRLREFRAGRRADDVLLLHFPRASRRAHGVSDGDQHGVDAVAAPLEHPRGVRAGARRIQQVPPRDVRLRQRVQRQGHAPHVQRRGRERLRRRLGFGRLVRRSTRATPGDDASPERDRLAFPSRVRGGGAEGGEVSFGVLAGFFGARAAHLALGGVEGGVRGDGVVERVDEGFDGGGGRLSGDVGGAAGGEEGDEDGADGAVGGADRDAEGGPAEVEALVDAPEHDGAPAEGEFLGEHREASGVEHEDADEGVGEEHSAKGGAEEGGAEGGEDAAHDGASEDAPRRRQRGAAGRAAAHDRHHGAEDGRGEHVRARGVHEDGAPREAHQAREARAEPRAEWPGEVFPGREVHRESRAAPRPASASARFVGS